MNKPAQFPFTLPEGFGAFAGPSQQSFEAMSHAYSEWLRNANRMQAELIRFIGDRFSKDVNLISKFTGCKQPEEFLKLQSEALTDLTNDYMQEGARIFALFTETSKATAEEFTKTVGTKRGS